MVEIIRDVWKDLLVDETSNPGTPDEKLPSPGQLRNKILVKVKYVPPKPPPESSSTQKVSSSSSSSSDDETEKDPKKKKKSKILDALSRLGVYTRSYHFSSFSQPEAAIPTHVFALSEKALMKVHETHAPALFSHNRVCILWC